MRVTTRAAALAAQFAAVSDEVIATVTGCTDAQWQQLFSEAGWSVGVVAHHIAAVHGDFVGLIGALAGGRTFSPTTSMDDVDRSNAQHARDFATVGKPETLALLQANGVALLEQLRGLSDEQLGRIAGVFGGHELSVMQAVELIVIGHAQVHLDSIRATIAA